MDPEITPSEIRRAEFKTTLRGFDRTEVESFLARVAGRLEEMEERAARLATAAGDVAERDLDEEFDTIGREVTAILQAAREAADSMRERAALDAARWRAEAMEEAEANRKQAAADAEALRRDAWATGSELLAQAVEEANRMLEQADRDVLTIQGEAEREAHRLTSSARREAEDLVRNARMDAEKTTTDAAKRRDDIIDQANRQAAAAQERTRALEQRRDALMVELENVRSTLSRLEGNLEEKREKLEPSVGESTSVKVVPPEKEDPDHWQMGETVRVVKPDEETEHIVDIDLPSQDFGSSRIEEQPGDRASLVEVIPSSPSRGGDEEEVAEDAPEPEPVPEDVPPPVDESVSEAAPGEEAPEPRPGDDVGALFEALREESRDGDDSPAAADRAEIEDEGDDTTDEADGVGAASRDWIEIRDARLLPITNRALRGAKRALTELQNIALDGLRTEEGWTPDTGMTEDALRAELIAVWAESFAAGHAVAEEMTDSKIDRPPTPEAESVPEFSNALARAVAAALEDAGEDQRDRQLAVSRVFRVWRTDEAERRIRELAIRSYHLGVERSVGAGASVG